MKLAVIGFGQAGSNIADELYAVNNYAKSLFNRRIEIVTDCFAVNTDEADLGGFKNIPKDKNHRILIGGMSTFGHGVGKINTDAASIIKGSNSVVTDTILRSSKFHESDAVMAISSGGGGTGSGTIGWAIKSLKERIEKPVYAIIALPFAFELKGTTSYAAMNTATCISTVLKYADATFLVDNERYRKSGDNLAKSLQDINQGIARDFYDLCCAGEERNGDHVGSKVLDAGDIRNSLGGISVIGRGLIDLPSFTLWKSHFRESAREKTAILGALTQAEANLGLSINMEDARKVLFLLSGPKNAIDLSSVEDVSQYLQKKSPNAVIRSGDYPRGRDISITLIFSELVKVAQLESMFMQAEDLFKRKEEIQQDNQLKLGRLREFAKNLPSLD